MPPSPDHLDAGEPGGDAGRLTHEGPTGSDPRAGADPVAVLDEQTRQRGWRSLAIDVGPLRRHREFRLLFVGQGASFLGSMITYVALPYQVYDLTRSNLAVGLLGAVEFVAVVSTAFVGGALADAVDRRRMVRVTDGLLMLASAVLVLNALRDEPSVAVLFVLAGAMTVLDALQRPSLDALVPRLVPRDELLAASALSSLRMNVGMLAGPAVGGVLIAAFGLPVAYGVDVVTFAVSLLALQRMRAVPPPPDAERPSLRGVVEGFRYAKSRPELVGTYVVDMNAMFTAMPNALYPAIAASFGGPQVLGLLYTAPAVGSLVASLTSGWTRRVHRHGMGVIWAAGAWGAAITVFGLSPWLWLCLLMLALAGAADMISGLFRSTIWNTTIPDHLRGRLAGIEMFSYASGPTLGNVRAGAVAAGFSPRVSVVSGGLLCIAGTVLLAALLPAFRSYDARDHAAPAEPPVGG